jgi:hypothetical protein
VREVSFRAVCCVLVISACATTPKAGARNVSCEIDVELVSEPYVGVASSPNDARKTLADAWQAACAKLHADSPGTVCDDPLQVVASTKTRFQTIGGVVTQSAEVQLRRVVKLLHQRAEGVATSPLELCRSATKTLCATAPEELSCFQLGVECEAIDEASSRCAPAERGRVQPSFSPR